MEQRLREAEFNFNDFLSQLNQIKRMGPLSQLLSMIPGFSSVPGLDQLSFDDKNFKRFEAIILSMTPEERSFPDVIDGSRRKRISTGSGNDIQSVNALLKQFSQMRQMMKNLGAMSKKHSRLSKFFGGRA